MKIHKRTLATVAIAAASATAQAALQARDSEGSPLPYGDSAAVFYYDTEQNITWLRDWNLGLGSSFDSVDGTTDGLMTWANASLWANSLTHVGGGWRLPTALNADGSGPCQGYNCPGSEMGALWFSLGNTANGGLTHEGPFQSLQGTVAGGRWTSTEFAHLGTYAYVFYMQYGLMGDSPKIGADGVRYAVAVRLGDIAPVPEPSTYASLFLGLGILAIVIKSRRSI